MMRNGASGTLVLPNAGVFGGGRSAAAFNCSVRSRTPSRLPGL